MSSLSHEQLQGAIDAMHGYLTSPLNPDGQHQKEVQLARDQKRQETIEYILLPLLNDYLSGKVDLSDFKSQIDSINKTHEYWGFKGIKGQMFFNIMLNIAPDLKELDSELKAAIIAPADENLAESRMRTFSSYVRRLGEDYVESGGSPRRKPKPSSVPFFLSYFWQIQEPNIWPVFYTNSVQVIEGRNLWESGEDLADDYISYKHLHEELAKEFTKASGENFGLYDVEHVFWFLGGNPFGGDKPQKKDNTINLEPTKVQSAVIQRLPDSYVPPVVQILSQLARNDESLADAAKASGTTIPRAFEKSLNTAFTILGYETKLLGQGQGRVPDGIAIDYDNSYAIIWDAKARSDKYSMGTDDRTIREYITSQSRDFKKRKSFRNVYYVIVSSDFAEDYDDPITNLKMETDVSEVLLIKVDAILAMVDARLRSPLQVTLGSDGLQRLFTVSGVLTSEKVRELIA